MLKKEGSMSPRTPSRSPTYRGHVRRTHIMMQMHGLSHDAVRPCPCKHLGSPACTCGYGPKLTCEYVSARNTREMMRRYQNMQGNMQVFRHPKRGDPWRGFSSSPARPARRRLCRDACWSGVSTCCMDGAGVARAATRAPRVAARLEEVSRRRVEASLGRYNLW